MLDFLLSLERLLLALTIGGGVVMVVAVRPALLAEQGPTAPADGAAMAERVMVRAWTGYNRAALAAALLVLPLEAFLLLGGGQRAWLRLAGCAALVLLLLWKLRLDAELARGAAAREDHRRGTPGSPLDRSHKRVERATAAALLLALLLTF
ncbi:hypothetical protein [Streptomyces sp. NPDC058757]|uniref:hypothetical protein n=1 Tax=Streptomyces sp. NPDC058757 TaxID=3346626 RepID=UPI0036C3DB6D